MRDIQADVRRVFELNEKWWRDIRTNLPIERNEGELFMLMTSELAEAMEGERKNLMDDKLPQFPMAGVEMVDFDIRVKDYCGRRGLLLQDRYEERRGYWDSLLPHKVNRAELIWNMVVGLTRIYEHGYRALFEREDAFSILIADAQHYCRIFGYPFDEMWEAKFQYNVDRADHKHENRILDDGKKF